MKKSILLTFIFLTVALYMTAQENNFTDRHFIDISAGDNLDLKNNHPGDVASVLSARGKNAFMFSFRYSYYIGKQWGAYVDIQASYLGNPLKNSENLSNLFGYRYNVMDRNYYENYKSSTTTFNIGVVYRIEVYRWSIRPRIGLGFGETDASHYNLSLIDKEDQEHYTAQYFSRYAHGGTITRPCITPGVSVAYKISPYIYLLADISYTQLLKKVSSGYQLIHDRTGEIVDQNQYTARSLGRHLNLSLGVSVPLYFHKRDKKDTNQPAQLLPIP